LSAACRPTCVEELLHKLPVDGEVAEGGAVGGALRHGAPGQPHVVARAQDEDGAHLEHVSISSGGGNLALVISPLGLVTINR